MDPILYTENIRKVLYVQVLKALYEILVEYLRWYKKFRKDLEKEGFKFNPYNVCVKNRQVTVWSHMDYLTSSHMDKKVSDKFYE